VRNYVNLRLGPSLTQEQMVDRPNICMEVAPIRLMSVEACGTGSGFLHTDPAPEFAHFRTNWHLTDWRAGEGWLRPRLGVGFTELQVGEDAPGFHFTSAGPNGVETAGPEATVSVQYLRNVGGGLQFVGELHAGFAWLPHAPALVTPMSAAQSFAGFTIGVGF
jgi:hypothetical protein